MAYQKKGHDPTQRDANGNFAKGNKMGGTNPFIGTINQIRKWMFETIKKGDWEEIRDALLKESKAGNIKAMQLLFSYVLGKPVQNIDMNMVTTQIAPEEAQKRLKTFFGLPD